MLINNHLVLTRNCITMIVISMISVVFRFSFSFVVRLWVDHVQQSWVGIDFLQQILEGAHLVLRQIGLDLFFRYNQFRCGTWILFWGRGRIMSMRSLVTFIWIWITKWHDVIRFGFILILVCFIDILVVGFWIWKLRWIKTFVRIIRLIECFISIIITHQTSRHIQLIQNRLWVYVNINVARVFSRIVYSQLWLRFSHKIFQIHQLALILQLICKLIENLIVNVAVVPRYGIQVDIHHGFEFQPSPLLGFGLTFHLGLESGRGVEQLLLLGLVAEQWKLDPAVLWKLTRVTAEFDRTRAVLRQWVPQVFSFGVVQVAQPLPVHSETPA